MNKQKKLTPDDSKKPADAKVEMPQGPLANESGRVGYIVAWFLGVPTSVLLFIFLIRGH